MHKKKCNKCNKLFSRQWNLDRHLQDVHEIYDDTKKEKRSREIDDYNYWQRNIDSNNNFWITSNNSDDINYNQRSYSNNFSNTFPNPGYYHGEHFLFSNFNSQSKKEKRLNVDDRIKIQKVLKILENTLKKFILQLMLFGQYRGYIIDAYLKKVMSQ